MKMSGVAAHSRIFLFSRYLSALKRFVLTAANKEFPGKRGKTREQLEFQNYSPTLISAPVELDRKSTISWTTSGRRRPDFPWSRVGRGASERDPGLEPLTSDLLHGPAFTSHPVTKQRKWISHACVVWSRCQTHGSQSTFLLIVARCWTQMFEIIAGRPDLESRNYGRLFPPRNKIKT